MLIDETAETVDTRSILELLSHIMNELINFDK